MTQLRGVYNYKKSTFIGNDMCIATIYTVHNVEHTLLLKGKDRGGAGAWEFDYLSTIWCTIGI